jgi:hypothetical protein
VRRIFAYSLIARASGCLRPPGILFSPLAGSAESSCHRPRSVKATSEEDSERASTEWEV